MSHDTPPPSEAPRRLVERTRIFVASYPRLEFRREGFPGEASIEFERGAIRDARGKFPEKPICVPTDTGVIVEAEREIGTDRMWGCATVIIRHPKGKLFAHLTPTNKLAYMDWDEKIDQSNETTAKEMVRSLEEAGLSLRECRGTIIGNLGTSSGKYERARLLKIWNHLGERLRAAGLAHWKTIEVPLDETLVFHTPDKPGKAFVMGHLAKIGEGGLFEVDHKEVDARWVELE